MPSLTDHANALSPAELPPLTPGSPLTLLAGSAPILATPAAVAGGVTLAVGAAGAGYAVEEANDG